MPHLLMFEALPSLNRVRLFLDFLGFVLGINFLPREALDGLVEVHRSRSLHLALQVPNDRFKFLATCMAAIHWPVNVVSFGTAAWLYPALFPHILFHQAGRPQKYSRLPLSQEPAAI